MADGELRGEQGNICKMEKSVLKEYKASSSIGLWRQKKKKKRHLTQEMRTGLEMCGRKYELIFDS